MLKLNEVSKKYNSKFAVKNINLTIEPGNIYLFIGENGSGKSTTIKLISKVIFTNQYNIFENKFKRIMYLPDKRNYPILLSTFDFLKYYLNVKREIIKNYLLRYELPNKTIGSLSKGNLQKLGILQVILSEGDLYLLDEPTDGLDKKSIDLFIEDLKELLMNNKTIIISTHKKTIYSELKPVLYKFEDGICNEKKRKRKAN